ncbi:DNA-binding protein [Pseudomonas syringae]|uniref:DNA-binding protein n=1 Tax=Pseudomonas syringae TaxID=317 RepID=UPI001F1F36C8|nr:DNA-binding protein [Pseudomonas syringae]MCF5371241.1 DNA-binding protein [Pseudomonas syringae]MCF5381908.1 DNA-binding protein [Pseudomonas syringae]MCF5424042.1 DNA-binding protein [Pseudomonas syringae]MCF5454923.1 DNA-binding protein [Pseudomonas syringae]MCF5459253.1 DNA-binding protein [Pseudomonas syringae]
MNAVTNPIARAALKEAQFAVNILNRKSRPTPTRERGHSSTADKFVVRGYVELMAELTGISDHEGRSTNGEVVAAILDALGGHQRSFYTLHVLKSHLGHEKADRILSEVPDFDLSLCRLKKKTPIRLPNQVRDKIRDGVQRAAEINKRETPETMNKFVLDAMVAWVVYQRQHYALLTAVIEMDQLLIE